jgi:DsbC/DsbD-like thiol-disulfide interchange protein
MRRHKVRVAAAIWIGIAALPGLAGEGKPAHVTVGTPERVTLKPGATVRTQLRIQIAEGFHVQANPASNRFLIPTEVKFEPAGGIKADELTYPPGQPHRLQGADSDISTYEGFIQVGVTIQAEETADPGDLEYRGSLRYQACDAKRCFPPKSIPVSVPVRIAEPESRARDREGGSVESEPQAKTPEEKRILGVLDAMDRNERRAGPRPHFESGGHRYLDAMEGGRGPEGSRGRAAWDIMYHSPPAPEARSSEQHGLLIGAPR